MARPAKTGLDYFPMDVDYYDDFKIMDLLNEYGPLGTTIYEIIISKIYKNGYYLEVPLDKLATQLVRIIGNRWIKDKNLVLQVIQYCADIGLFNNALLTQSVITSVGIQRRYSEVTVRNKVDKSKYWLLDKNSDHEVLITVPKNPISVTETNINVAETKLNATKKQQKESKVNKSKVNKSRAVLKLPCTNGIYDVMQEQVETLQQVYKNIDVMESLLKMADFANTNPNKQRPLDGVEVWIRKWLTEDNNKAIAKAKNNSVKNNAMKKKSDTSYDINDFMKYDIFD